MLQFLFHENSISYVPDRFNAADYFAAGISERRGDDLDMNLATISFYCRCFTLVNHAILESFQQMATRAGRIFPLISGITILTLMIPHHADMGLVLVKNLQSLVLNAYGIADSFKNGI